MKIFLKCSALFFGFYLVSTHLIAAERSPYPDDFELVCDRVFVIGHERKHISSSYISWNKERFSLAIKSEDLNEFNGELNPNYYKVYSSNKENEENILIEITFKQLFDADKWQEQNHTRVISLTVKSGLTSNNAVIKLTDFFIKYGVVQEVTTKHATCNIRSPSS